MLSEAKLLDGPRLIGGHPAELADTPKDMQLVSANPPTAVVIFEKFADVCS